MTAKTKTKTKALLRKVKEANQDFEWYPTKQDMIDVIGKKLSSLYSREAFSLLDIGAGDGRVFGMIEEALENYEHGPSLHNKYAIEKSPRLIQAMPDDICIIGTDFTEQTLIDKKVDVVFCNPPYSEFEAWATRILTEANAKQVFMILPSRWKDSESIKQAVEKRKAITKVLKSTNFLASDREARARVDIIHFNLTGEDNHYSYEQSVDPFDLWFDEHFKIAIASEKNTEDTLENKSEKARANIVKGSDVIKVLVTLYRDDLDKLLENYKAVEKLDSEILMELNVSVKGLKDALKGKIKGLKSLYWNELFSRLKALTNRLTTDTRKEMLDKFNDHLNVDFTEANISAVVIWAIKNANRYIDSQLLSLYERMTSTENVVGYKSNSHIVKDTWRYAKSQVDSEKSKNYKLEYRLVLSNYLALLPSKEQFAFDYDGNLHKSAHDYISDIFTVAHNLGFPVLDNTRSRCWESNQAQVFEYQDHEGNIKELCHIRAFKNGNIHIKASKDFMRAFNIEAGRLNGWIKSPREAAEQMGIPKAVAERFYMGNFRIESTLLLTA